MRGGEATSAGAWFLAPFAVGAALLVLVPAALTAALAFTDASGLATPRPNGLTDLRRLTDDPLLFLWLLNPLYGPVNALLALTVALVGLQLVLVRRWRLVR